MSLTSRVPRIALPNLQLALFAASLLAVLQPVPSWAQSSAGDSKESGCEALASVDLAQAQDAPTQVIESKLVGAKDDLPAYCQVSGYVTPSVGFLLRLPPDSWNGKFIELGCGGFCGYMDHIHDCDAPLRKGYACIVSDNGHKSTGSEGLWAYNNLQAQIDHAYRAAHVTALAGKAIVERYYGHAPHRSYFWGCSTGGRQGMMEAQRFPWDFDGIIAGCPSLSVTGIHMNLLWGNRALTDKSGALVLGQADLDLLHRGVLAQCDLNDGVRDGLIGDPRRCAYDPAELLCKAGNTTNCLTAQKLEVVRKIYSGPVTSQGEQIYPSSAMKGSELTWLGWYRGPHGTPSIYKFVREEFRYSAFIPSPGPEWRPEDFDFDRDYKRLGMTDGLYDAVNPDLRKFKAAGGKLIAYAGWSDAAGMPGPAVDYYETAQRTLGGRVATQDFFRLFVIPGMDHCYGGDGAYALDWLGYLENWVEQGKAPEKLVGAHLRLDNPDDEYEMLRRLRFPLDPGRITFSRPVYPYPIAAKYAGRGDPNDAGSFRPDRSPELH